MHDWLLGSENQYATSMAYTETYKPDRILPIEFVVLHYTAVSSLTALQMLTQKKAVSCYECRRLGTIDGRSCSMCLGTTIIPFKARSAHFLVDRTGQIVQLAPINWRTFHAGGPTSMWRDTGRVNERSIGIELENFGPLTCDDAVYRAWSRMRVPQSSARRVGDAYWHNYPEVQILSTLTLLDRLYHKFPQLLLPHLPVPDTAWLPGERTGVVVGHEHIDPQRKQDPGPLFPWDRIRARWWETRSATTQQ